MRVSVIEDSQRLRDAVCAGLRKSGYAVDGAGDGPVGLWYAESNEYDVIVLDLMLPGIDGLTLLKRLRDAGRDTHVLVLTARDTVEDRVRGLRSGADDYLVKPFAFDELLARVEALVRRRHSTKSPRLEVGGLVIDSAARTVMVDGRAVDLPPREYALLEYLAARRGAVVSRAEIEAHIYDDRAGPMSNVVDAAVYAVRRKVDPPGGESYIQTRRGAGYVLRDPRGPA
ncbi:MAG: response regulator transcription factor [Phycisphaerae bacterium]|nr:response regulator transcription factor [Tepidisphaeraceae bacterium]